MNITRIVVSLLSRICLFLRVIFFTILFVSASVQGEPFEEVDERVSSDFFGLNLELHAHAGSGFYLAIVLAGLFSIVCWHGCVILWRYRSSRGSLPTLVASMRSMLDAIEQPVFIRDRAGRLVYANPRYLEILTANFAELKGKKITESPFLPQEEAELFHSLYLRVMHDRQPRVGGSKKLAPHATTTPIMHWVFPFFNRNGRVVGLIAGWADVTDRQQLVDQLKASQKEAEDANKAKTTFLATMSHEIRTPMNAVLGMLEMASKRAEQGVIDRLSLDVASSAANGLVDLIGDILDIARIESGQLTLTPGRVNLTELCKTVTRIFDGVAQQNYLDLKVDLDPRGNCDVWVDSLRLKQVLSNLLSNAIKFTVSGEVCFSLRCVPINEAHEMDVIFNVIDTGIGISPDDQARLFSPFTQVGAPNDSMRRGSGLGLSITRTICEMMAGTLSLASEVGKGTDISISLRLPVLEYLSPVPKECVESINPPRRLRVLVVDDYPANRVLISQQLTYLGHDVSDSEDGAMGLRAWRNGAFDVVISDCHMPVMNGYALAGAIRSEESRLQLPSCLIIGLTANALPGEKERCLDAGMNDCMFKPISLRDLGDRLASVDPLSVSASWKEVSLGQGRNVDLTTLRQLGRGDDQAIGCLIQDLADSLDEDAKRLSDLFFKNDCQGLSDLAHRVKGGAGIVGGQNTVIRCNRLEEVCRSGTQANLKFEVDALAQAMTILSTELRSKLRLGPTGSHSNL